MVRTRKTFRLEDVRKYIYIALALALAYTHYVAYSSGKQSVLSRLQNDRIEILKDGKRIDEGVLAADDLTLVCLLTDCDK